ncbi:MAG: DUF2017 domain-containing protein [Nocardioidaceae bacterium]
MIDWFQPARGGKVVATFSGFEADLLRMLAQQLVELLRNEMAEPRSNDPLEQLLDFSGPTSAPEDPVLARFFPTAYPDDDEAAGEFRRFTEGTLRDGKARNAALVIDTLEESGLPPELGNESIVIDVELDRDATMGWMKSLTDMRLALATRLGVEEGDDDDWAGLDEEDPRFQAYQMYGWLGVLQETLVDAAARSGK